MGYILIIEDNQANADIMARTLTSAGFQVKHTLRGLEGAKLAREERPDLILMDFDLPDVSGQTITMVIRKQLGQSAPPIVAVTGRTEDAERRRARDIGCTAFVAKPFTPDQLLNTVNFLLSKTTVKANVVIL